MKISLSHLALAFAAGSVAANKHNEYTIKICTTIHAFRPVGIIPTKIATITEPYTIYNTKPVQKTVTLTPKAITSTITKTRVVTKRTTKSHSTRTAHIKTTVYTTVTSTAAPSTTTVQSTTQTDKVLKPTTTIATMAGFIPIQSSLPGAKMEADDGVPTKRHVHKHRRHPRVSKPMNVIAKPGANFVKPVADWVVSGGQGIAPQGRPQFPQSVECQYVIQIPTIVTRVKKLARKTVKGPTPTSIKVINATVTNTKTIFPNNIVVSVTSTVQSTVTSSVIPTTTTTTTITVTNIVDMPEATYYAQCDRSNMANKVGSNWMAGGVLSDTDVSLDITNADNPYDCCAACAAKPDCVVSVLVSDGTCQIISQGASTCTPSSPCTGNIYLRATETEDWVAFFNGPAVVWNQASDPISD